MPIDYSKFDNILDSDDEDDAQAKAPPKRVSPQRCDSRGTKRQSTQKYTNGDMFRALAPRGCPCYRQ